MRTPQQMVRYLIEQGLTQKEIADAVGTSQPRISALAKGDGCNYFLGKKLEMLYMELVKSKLEA